MRRSCLLAPIVMLSLIAPLFAADEVAVEGQAVQTKIESVGLFKNGLAVVERTVELPGGGTFRIEDVPTPVHGTFFIESATPVTTRVTTTLVDAPLDLAKAPLQEQLAGKTVRVTLREKDGPVEGTVATIDAADDSKWNRRYETTRDYYPGVDAYGNRIASMPGAGRFLILDTKAGRSLGEHGLISSNDIVGDAKTATVRRPGLLL